MTAKATQQEFLRAAMEELGQLQGLGRSLTREELCARLGCPITTFNKWMLNPPPAGAKAANYREMPLTMWSHINEVIEHERLKIKASERLPPHPK
jgi:hypothetical protein